MTRTTEQSTITCIGPEGAGKTTLCNSLAPRIGAAVLFVPEWPIFRDFMEDPSQHAYQNQQEAMAQTVRALQTLAVRHSGPIVADTCPERIHRVYSWQLHNQGHISGEEMTALERQYHGASALWGPNYVYLSADETTLRSHIRQRDRPEDEAYNLQKIAGSIQRWEEVTQDEAWRVGKNILELVASQPQNEVTDAAYEWYMQTVNTEERYE